MCPPRLCPRTERLWPDAAQPALPASSSPAPHDRLDPAAPAPHPLLPPFAAAPCAMELRAVRQGQAGLRVRVSCRTSPRPRAFTPPPSPTTTSSATCSRWASWTASSAGCWLGCARRACTAARWWWSRPTTGCRSPCGAHDRRTATPANLHEVAPVPLFVKLPGSERGVVSESYASTADVLPTIARALAHPAAPACSTATPRSAPWWRARTGVSMVRRDFGGRIRLGAAGDGAPQGGGAFAARAGVRHRLVEAPLRDRAAGRAARPRGGLASAVARPGPAEARFAAPHGAGRRGHHRSHAAHMGGGPDLVPRRRRGRSRAGRGRERHRAGGGPQLPAGQRSARVLLAACTPSGRCDRAPTRWRCTRYGASRPAGAHTVGAWDRP